jgi:large subunit ribosomal protein L1
MPKKGKRHTADAAKVEAGRQYSIDDALKVVRSFSKAKFDESVRLDVKLGIDTRKQDQNLRGAISLPNGTGKTARVICFAEGEAAEAARAAGAVEVGSAELAKRIEDGWTDFDVAVATPDQMRVVGRLGKILGPQGKMPAPKAGTVTNDVGTAVREFTAGKIEFRADSGGNVYVVVGKRSFSDEKLAQNIQFMLTHLRTLKPSTVKGQYMVGATISATMSPGVALSTSDQ